jgi:hypothetical protein
MDAGASAHEQHGQTVQVSIWLSRAGLVCLALGILMLVFFLMTR